MAKQKKFMTMDGNTAAAHTSYAFTEVAGIYPITPSSPMADLVDQWSQDGRENLFGQTVDVIEMQSEGGAAAVCHGSLNAGALATTYTASQGLLLMIPTMYKIAGELLPGVFHVSARAVAAHALSIFGDHTDVMAARQTGFALLASDSVQQAMDLAAVAHLSAIKGRVPFVHFFDGFRTSHEVQKVEVLDYEGLKDLIDMDAVQAFRDRALTPNDPNLRGSAQNPDVFFQNREASNRYYDNLFEVVDEYMTGISELTGRDYKFFNYHGAEDAEHVIVAMGSINETIQTTVDYLNAQGGKYGAVSVHLYRPWNTDRFLEVFPKTVKNIAVLDRTKEPGAQGEPLLQDVIQSFRTKEDAPRIIGGRYGLGSKDTTPDDIVAAFKNLTSEDPKNEFTLAILDDVTHLSLPRETHIDVVDDSTVSCRFWGLGSDGTVGANKNSIRIIGDHTDKYAQAYFSYDSKKSGGITISDLRFGDKPIKAPYLINAADFVSCSQQSYIGRYDMLDALKEGGSFLLNTSWNEEELEANLPADFKRTLVEKNIRFFTVDAVDIAAGLGLGNRTNTVLQAAFFKLSSILPVDEAVTYMKEAIVRSYGSKGDDIVQMNYGAVDAGIDQVKEIEVPAKWAQAEDEEVVVDNSRPAFVRDIADIMNAQQGDRLPVSAFIDREDGTLPQGTSQYEKRGIATLVPEWIPENCIQCNQCSYVCPHAVIRPFLATEEEAANAPEGTEFKDGMRPYNDMKYRMQVSVLDCTGCGSCWNTCPAKTKALQMVPFEEQVEEGSKRWEYFINLPEKTNPMGNSSVKGSQFNRPLLEFSGACAGCGETPYAKLVTQLFGDRTMISNATGCSSIWGGSAPAQPYTTNQDGRGPSWVNSLFEDNAENGLGLHKGYEQIRKRAFAKAQDLMATDAVNGEAKDAIQAWIDGFNTSDGTVDLSEKLAEALSNYEGDEATMAKVKDLLKLEDYFGKRSTWIFGGDGWAYDIGYGGLDHVLASGENINVLVFDTEVYSNTGGQASKATPTGAIAEFAAGGKKTRKKDLGMMAMSYGYVYVAQVSMGANQTQTLKAIAEAEAYDGPSLIIAYSPCINHGIRGGLTIAQTVMKDAVESGHWHLYRYNPDLAEEGKNPFILDSKKPTGDFRGFLKREVRFSSLMRKYPEEQVNAILEKAEKDSKDRYLSYLRKEKEWDLQLEEEPVEA